MTTTSVAPIAVAFGDGIGPEIMKATLSVLHAAGARLEINSVQIGEAIYQAGFSAGIHPETWATLRETRAFLKAPITTPQGGGFKSLNVTIRKTLGLYANVRPCQAYAPFVATRHPALDLVIVRENEEDLYAGIEHRQTDDVTQCLKLISRSGCERIVRYAFEYARRHGRRKVSCFTKDNIMKLTDGLFHRVFEEVAPEYPDLEHEHWIVDIGAAKLADDPDQFDVLVLPNLYGDILSDVAAQLAGSVGLAGSSNIGARHAMFEAIHGSAPRRAGQNVANPSGLLQGAVQMLVHLGQGEVAERVQNAWLKTLEDGLHTYDIVSRDWTHEQLGTSEFARAVCERLGQTPLRLPRAKFALDTARTPAAAPARVERSPEHKQLRGVDVFLDWRGPGPNILGPAVAELVDSPWQLTMITNRGVKVWPEGAAETLCTDHWRCRFLADGDEVSHGQVLALLKRFEQAGLDFIKTEHLYHFDGTPGYSLGQGQ